MFYSGSYWLFMIPGFLLVMLAQLLVKSTYRKWSKVGTQSNITGEEVARRLINYGGLYEVNIENVRGQLSDHYDPRSKRLRLSEGVALNTSVAAVAIAAHEIGHAMQDRDDYLPLRFRAALVPAVNAGSMLGWVLIFLGLFLGGTLGTQLAWVGVAAFGLGAVFALATIPVELNASARARELLQQTGLVTSSNERRGVSAVLNAAAFTYVAALASAVLQVLYYVTLISGRGRRR
jgi:uncharacterized protein